MRFYGYIGFLTIVVAEILLFTGNHFVEICFTPIVWTGYVVLIDAIVFKMKDRSLIANQRVEMLLVITISVAVWWLFEFYNAPRFWQSNIGLWWKYHNLPHNPYLRRVGYDWAFATIFPALFLTAELFAATVFLKSTQLRIVRVSKIALYVSILLGATGAIIPFVFISKWYVLFVWLSFTFLLDPINYIRAWPSIIGDVSRGNWSRLFALLASGAVCGFLWEFWNYWSVTRWTYDLPFFDNVKLFEMPLVGFLGFPPFVVECWVIYVFVRSVLQPAPRQIDDVEIFMIGQT